MTWVEPVSRRAQARWQLGCDAAGRRPDLAENWTAAGAYVRIHVNTKGRGTSQIRYWMNILSKAVRVGVVISEALQLNVGITAAQNVR